MHVIEVFIGLARDFKPIQRLVQCGQYVITAHVYDAIHTHCQMGTNLGIGLIPDLHPKREGQATYWK